MYLTQRSLDSIRRKQLNISSRRAAAADPYPLFLIVKLLTVNWSAKLGFENLTVLTSGSCFRFEFTSVRLKLVFSLYTSFKPDT